MNDPDLIVRPALLTDIPVLREFEQGVIEAEREFASNLIDGPVQYYDLDALIENEDAQLVVVERDAKLIASGYARIEMDKPYFTPQRYAYLGFMYVVPEQRGEGIIKHVFDALFAWSAEQGIEAHKLEVYSGNAGAIRAYEKLGFKAEMTTMLRGNA